MNFKEFAQYRFGVFAFFAANVTLLILITLFSVYGWNDKVLDEFVKWEYGAFTGLGVMLEQARSGGRAMDPGNKGPAGSKTRSVVTEDVERITEGSKP